MKDINNIDKFTRLDGIDSEICGNRILSDSGATVLKDNFKSKIKSLCNRSKTNNKILTCVLYKNKNDWNISECITNKYTSRCSSPSYRYDKPYEKDRIYLQIRPQREYNKFYAFNIFPYKIMLQISQDEYTGDKIIPGNILFNRDDIQKTKYKSVRNYRSNHIIFVSKPTELNVNTDDLENNTDYIWSKELCRNEFSECMRKNNYFELIENMQNKTPVINVNKNESPTKNDELKARKELYTEIKDFVTPILEPICKL